MLTGWVAQGGLGEMGILTIWGYVKDAFGVKWVFEAVKMRVGISVARYLLARGEAGGLPSWHLGVVPQELGR